MHSSLPVRSTFLERIWEHGFGASNEVRYGLGIALAFAAFALRMSLNRVWGSDFPFIFYFPTTLFAALYGGFGPALVSVILTATGTIVWVLPPLGRFVVTGSNVQGVLVYLLVDVMIAWVGARHRHVLNDRRKAEETLREQQGRLELALDRAREAGEAKDRFMANLSHELRTPLTPIAMVVSILQEDRTLPPAVRGALDTINRNVELETKMVNDLLDVARVVNRKLTLELSECDLHDVIQRALRICLPAVDGKNLNFVTKLESKRHRIRADDRRLQQLFWNLIQNAAKFTPANGSITIRSRDANGIVYVDVSDDGCGIEAERLEKIFEPFEQGGLPGRMEDGRRGLGVGLAIARHIAIAHGGNLAARSDGPNRGSTFTVSLPASHSGSRP